MSEDLTQQLRNTARTAGIDLIGVTSAEPFLIRGEKERRVAPKEILSGARAVIVAGFYVRNVPNIVPSEPGKPRGTLAPYGSKVYMKMRAYCQKVIRQFLRANGHRSVSSMRIPAKPAAVRAGLGKYGKNAVVYTRELGSWVMFECLVTDAPLDYEDADIEVTDCGECRVCLDACPTRAIYEPFKIDRARCITNWLWGANIPIELREKQGTRLFGCGKCLETCPMNKQLEPRAEFPVALEIMSDAPELIPLLTCDVDYFRSSVPSFPRWAGKDVIRGNAIIALGNIADPAAVSALGETLQSPKPRIRAYSAWALGKMGNRKATRILEEALPQEKNASVLKEIKLALSSERKD
jgi:epoxyqueuosine reductase